MNVSAGKVCCAVLRFQHKVNIERREEENCLDVFIDFSVQHMKNENDIIH